MEVKTPGVIRLISLFMTAPNASKRGGPNGGKFDREAEEQEKRKGDVCPQPPPMSERNLQLMCLLHATKKEECAEKGRAQSACGVVSQSSSWTTMEEYRALGMRERGTQRYEGSSERNEIDKRTRENVCVSRLRDTPLSIEPKSPDNNNPLNSTSPPSCELDASSLPDLILLDRRLKNRKTCTCGPALNIQN